MASLAKKPETNDEESFIILGSSPGTSLDLKCNGMEAGALDRGALDDAIKDLPAEASMAFKAHFKIESGPSPASLMVASTMITDDKSTEELQKSFGELLDENVILKETLKKNNDSMKEQFLLIASCQEDMLKTHMLHKEKFDETRELVEKLRQENKKLKLDIARLAEAESASVNNETGEQSSSSGPMSALEFVTSPDDDTIDKLTQQLELVEKQRRQVIVENEKLTWQKESLEHIIDATSKERDDLKEKVKDLELKLSSIEREHSQKVCLLNNTIKDLEQRLSTAHSSFANMSHTSTDELDKCNASMKKMEERLASLQSDLKAAQLKILELETVKLEFSKYKSVVNDSIKTYKEQIQELHNKLKEAHTTVFQPVRFSISSEPDGGGEYSSYLANVKLYDKTLKHLADLLNVITHGSTDSLVQCLGVAASLHEYKLDRSSVDTVRAGLADLRQQLDKQHSNALSNIGQVRGTLSIFEGIFKDYNQLLKKSLVKPEVKRTSAPNVEALTAALVARGEELLALQTEVAVLKAERENCELMKAQLDLYKSDFEAERAAREKMASEKETILTDLRTKQRRNQELLLQMEEVRKANPAAFRTATPKRAPTERPAGPPGGSQGPQRQQTGAVPMSGTRRQSTPANATTGNMTGFDRYGSPPDDDCVLM